MKLRYLFPVLVAASGIVFISRPPAETGGANHVAKTSHTAEPRVLEPVAPAAPETIRLEDEGLETKYSTALAILAAGDSSDRMDRLQQWAAQVPRESIRSLLAHAARFPDPRFRSETMYALFARWAAEDPENAVLLLRQYAASGQLP